MRVVAGHLAGALPEHLDVRLGEPVIRTAVAAAMREMGEQFVLGRTIAEAVKRGRQMTAKGYLYSYDMLGEAARTEADALRYFKAYQNAIAVAGETLDRRRHPLQSRHLGQAFGAASALRAGAEGDDAAGDGRAAAGAGACRPRRPHGPQHRCRGSRPARPFARRHRARAGRARARRLERLRRGGAGLRAARGLRHRLAACAGQKARPQDHGAAGQGRLLGYRDQARADARARRLSGLHAQGEHRRFLHRLRAKAAVDDRPHLSAVRHPQRAHRRRRARHGAGPRQSSSSSGCMAWASSCTKRCARPRARAAASMRRSARIPICLPIWCGVCSRTAPTRPSSIS